MAKNEQEYIAPVNHTGGSAFAEKAAGTASGAVKGGVKGALTGLALFTLAGIGLGVFVATGGIGATIAAASAALTAGGTSGLFGGLLGAAKFLGIVGLFTAGGVALGSTLGVSWGGVAGGIMGGAKGHEKASTRVAQERGQAAMLDAQIQLAQAQAYAPANDNKYNFPAQGSAMNPALASIQTDSIQRDGAMVGQNRAAAR